MKKKKNKRIKTEKHDEILFVPCGTATGTTGSRKHGMRECAKPQSAKH